MRLLLIILLSLAALPCATAKQPENPLAKYSSEWNDPKYIVCNTAEHTKYLSPKEKEVIFVLNMARMNPKLFCKSVVSKAAEISDFVDTTSEIYYRSLVKELWKMEPLGILEPDQELYTSAQCHAVSTGKTGYVGHDRQSAECRKKQRYRGECCQYGISDAVGIVLTLLIDQDVESLGHRSICLGPYTKMSPSYEPHKKYGYITVLDFK